MTDVLVVFGASGDLARKKTFPSLYNLVANGWDGKIIGYARSELSDNDFTKRLEENIKDKTHFDKFRKACSYHSGQYDKDDDFKKLSEKLKPYKRRLFYMALPPNVFGIVSEKLDKFCRNENALLIVEKPFGKDLESCKELLKAVGKHWEEKDTYRIDHFLGKEMVKNLMVLRFANLFFESIWNSKYIDNVQIVLKENFGTQGRGGYFDEYGIVRDVMQNHLLQLLTVVCMEKPVSLSANDIRDEKVKVLRHMPDIKIEDCIFGQYTAGEGNAGYKDDETVPNDSNAATYAVSTMYVNNDRWNGVPFIMRAGKALNESKQEIRVQFKDVSYNLFENSDTPLSRNELVVRLQPHPCVYLKMMTKQPNAKEFSTEITELDLSYQKKYQEARIPEAYESLFKDALNSNQSNFVRSDELFEAWRIFTPILHAYEHKKMKPIAYKYGSRSPDGVGAFLEKCGVQRDRSDYIWKPMTKL